AAHRGEEQRDPLAEDRDRGTTGIQRAAMRRAIDPLRETGHDDDAHSSTRSRDLASDAFAVRRHASRSYDRDGPPGESGRIAVDPQRIRRTLELSEPSRIASVVRADRDQACARTRRA